MVRDLVMVCFAPIRDENGCLLKNSKFLITNVLGIEIAVILKKVSVQRKKILIERYGYREDSFLFQSELSGLCGDYFIGYDKMYTLEKSIRKNVVSKVSAEKSERVFNLIKQKI